MIQVNITFLNPERASWIRIQSLMFKIHSCETSIELENLLDGMKDEISVEYINIPHEAKKLPVPHIGFRQLEIRFTPEVSSKPTLR